MNLTFHFNKSISAYAFILLILSLSACEVKEETPTQKADDFQMLPPKDTTSTGNPTNTNFGTLLGQGDMKGSGSYSVSGKAALYEKEGKQTFYFENLKSSNGPDLLVYLSKDLQAKDIISLGKLKSTSGNQIYELSSSVKVEEYKYALIWCKQFSVLFGSTELKK